MKWIVCFLTLLLAPTAAFAQVGTPSPYTFTVPLQLENLPETTRVRVDCGVSRLAGGVDGSFSAENEVARGETNVTVTGGRYSCDVVVPTTWRRAGATGAWYRCTFILSGPMASGGSFSAPTGPAYTRITGRAVTSATTFAEGTIP
jgi:hypothetical protein